METVADTICAISTPYGEGGIGVIRISGQKAHKILKRLFVSINNKKSFQSHKMYLGYIADPDNKSLIDEVFVVLMNAPKTYTREDVAEIYSHGGFASQKNILSCILKCGARLAEPGEFTKRAFLNGRIDLLQAESVLDIVQSETDTELASALEHLKGRLSEKINTIKDYIKQVVTEIEAQIDFSDEDIPVDKKTILLNLKKAKKELDSIIDSYYEGRAIKSGFEVLILGRTNVGKSSLLNAMLLEEKAIVTPFPGTTRDLVEDTIHIKGVKIKLIDTAGIRKPKNLAEGKGIERAKQKILNSDIIIWVLDGSEDYKKEDEAIFKRLNNKSAIAVINKIDLPQRIKQNFIKEKGIPTLKVSAKENKGIENLKEHIYLALMKKDRKKSGVLITNLRHRDALIKTRDSVERSIKTYTSLEPLEFTAFELHDALYNLGLITGETCPEEILNNIFEKFCIGK